LTLDPDILITDKNKQLRQPNRSSSKRSSFGKMERSQSAVDGDTETRRKSYSLAS